MNLNWSDKDKKTISRVILVSILLFGVVICPTAVRMFLAGKRMTDGASLTSDGLYLANQGIIYQCYGIILFAVSLIFFLISVCLYRRVKGGTFSAASLKETFLDVKGRVSRAMKELRIKTDLSDVQVEANEAKTQDENVSDNNSEGNSDNNNVVEPFVAGKIG